MGEKSNIAWTDSTFNPVIGCMKVSAGCDNCYAETLMDKRYHRVQWGQRKTDDTAPSIGTRVRTSPANWRLPIRWNSQHASAQMRLGHPRQRVFCASLSDVFDNQWEKVWRLDLWLLIYKTQQLDWLLLTKRPENIAEMLPATWGNGWPNVWLGTTAEDQAAYDKRWPILGRIPARVHFISYEPAIGPLHIGNHQSVPDWMICGGESGNGHRDMNLKWAADVKFECEHYEIPFFMKQVSGVKPHEEDIPTALMLRQFPRSP